MFRFRLLVFPEQYRLAWRHACVVDIGFAVAISVLAGMESNPSWNNITAVSFSQELFISGEYGATTMHARTLMIAVGGCILRFVQL
jgi:hypothetical protein